MGQMDSTQRSALLMLLIVLFISACSMQSKDSSCGQAPNVYIFAGQSNMEGQGKISALAPDQKQPLPRVWFWNGRLFEPLDASKTLLSSQPGYFGPELNFARTLKQAQPDRDVYIIKYFSSGKALDSGWDDQTWAGDAVGPNRWNFYPGQSPADLNQGNCYRQMIEMIQTALGQLRREQLDYAIRAIIWVQGEQDSKNETSASRYARNLKTFYHRLCTDIQSDTPFLLYSELLPHEPAAPRFTHREQIRRSQRHADADSGHPEAIDKATWVPTKGCPVYETTAQGHRDAVHYTTEGQLLLGERLAQAFLSIVKGPE